MADDSSYRAPSPDFSEGEGGSFSAFRVVVCMLFVFVCVFVRVVDAFPSMLPWTRYHIIRDHDKFFIFQAGSVTRASVREPQVKVVVTDALYVLNSDVFLLQPHVHGVSSYESSFVSKQRAFAACDLALALSIWLQILKN